VRRIGGDDPEFRHQPHFDKDRNEYDNEKPAVVLNSSVLHSDGHTAVFMAFSIYPLVT
jgi:hypothetical protein